MTIEAVYVPPWRGLGQGQHSDVQKKISEYLKSVQSVMETLANRVKDLEIENVELKKQNEDFKQQLKSRTNLSPEETATRWENFLKKGNKLNNSQEEVMLFEKVIDESRARMEKENNIVISGVPLQIDNGEDSVTDEDLVSNILEEIGIQNPRTKMRKVSRLKKNPQLPNTKPPPLIVELCDKDTKLRVLKSAKNLKDSESFNKCFINPDLTRNELAIEIELRKRRNLENSKLEQGDGRLKYGELQNGTKFYWGVRFGKLCRINKDTKRALPSQ